MGTPCNWSCQGELSHIVEFDSILPEICVGWVVGWVFYRCFSSKFKTVKELRHKRSQDLWAFISWLHFHEDVDELAIEPVSPSPVSASVEVGESGVDGPMVEASVVRSQRMENQYSQANVEAEASEPTEQGATRKVPRSESCKSEIRFVQMDLFFFHIEIS